MEAACIIVYGQSSGPGDSMSAVPAVKYNVAVTPELQKNRSDEVKKYKEVKNKLEVIREKSTGEKELKVKTDSFPSFFFFSFAKYG